MRPPSLMTLLGCLPTQPAESPHTSLAARSKNRIDARCCLSDEKHQAGEAGEKKC